MRLLSVQPDRRRLRLPLALFAGAVLLFQLAWLVSVAPFHQMDEIDHAYRAASVAHGHITSSTITAPNARGNILRAPEAMVAAAHSACRSLSYMKPGNCSPLSTPDSHGDVLIGSAAANYNPVYYLVVGIPAVYLAPDSGASMLVIMRVVTMLWCDFLILAALVLTSKVARSIWPTLGVMITAMPVLLCASVAVAPNGVQMAGGLLMWAAMCGLIFGEEEDPGQRSWLLALWALGSCCVLTSHSTGPLWFGLTSIVGLALLGKSRLVTIYKTHRRALLTALGSVLAANLYSVFWTLSAKTNLPSKLTGIRAQPSPTEYFLQPLLWLVQCIGAVPFRNNLAPTIAYAFGLALIVGFFATAVRQNYRRGRWALIMISLGTLAVSLVLNFAAYATDKNGWQGRYALAFSYGVPLLAGWIIGTRIRLTQLRSSGSYVLAISTGVAIALINVMTVIHAWNTWGRPGYATSARLSPPPTALIITLAIVAALLTVAATERLAHRRYQDLDNRADLGALV